jgi:TolA-binding protein
MMPKHRRKDLKHDEFKETVENIIIFYEHHKKAVLWIATGVVILLIILFTYRNNKQTKMAKSKEMYNMGVILYNNGNFNQAKMRFQAVVDEYWGTIFFNRSTFMLANISYKEGNLDDALEKFRTFISGSYDEFFTPSAYQGIGQCYEQRGDLVSAIDNYKVAADKFKDTFAKSECLLNLARLYLAQQRTNEAEAVLKEVLEISEDAEIIEKAQKKLKLIQIQKELNE